MSDITAINGGNTYSTPPTTFSLGGVITLVGVSLTFNLNSTTNKVASVTITATSASLNLGGAVTSTINTISGSYDVSAQTFSLTLGSGTAGSISIGLSSFVSISAASASLTYNAGSTTSVTLSNTSTQSVSLLTIGISDATIIAGVNVSTANPVGVELDHANLALASMSATNGTTYYGIVASATALKGDGLPNDIQVGAGDLNVQINGTSDGSSNVVNFDTSFTNPGGKGLAIPGAADVLDFTGSLIQVSGTLNLDVTNYIQISGGFKFTQTANEMDITVGSAAFTGATDLTLAIGPSDNPLFSATGSLQMSLTATTFTLISASLTVNTPLKIASVLEIDTLTATLTNLSINLATGNLSGVVDAGGVHDPVLTVTAASATLFPGGGAVTGSVTATPNGDGLGVQGTFDLSTGAFSITLEQFNLTVGSAVTASATNVLVTYDPTNTAAHQQLIQIGAGTIDFPSFGVSGSLTNLIIYTDGFHFDSVTVNYTGDLTLGSLLTLTDPSVTLTDFGVTFGGGNASFSETGSLTVSVTSASLAIGPISASVKNLSITVGLDESTLGDVTITAGELDFQFLSYVLVTATNVNINTNPDPGAAYLSVGSATVVVTVTSSFKIGGTANNFSIINNGGTPEFYAGLLSDPNAQFGFNLTAPSPSQLGLPSWLGFSITQFGITWVNFTSDPTNFQITLSASINSISGLPTGVNVSGTISDVIINVGELGTWLSNPTSANFPISFGPNGGFGGTVSGTLFGLNVSATFVGGITSFNQEGDTLIATGTSGVYTVADTTGLTLTATQQSGLNDTVLYGSGLYVGIAGTAGIPGVGDVSISVGFSSLGPLSFFLSYSSNTPLILDPESGLAISGFSGGVAFNTSLGTPTTATDLPGVMSGALLAVTGSSTGNVADINVATWQTQLELATAAQFVASNGGTNLSAAYSQPFVILASVTLDDAYLSADAFQITGTMVLGINPNAGPGEAPVTILVKGSVVLGGSSGFSGATGYLYASVTSASASLMFLVQEPGGDTPIESFGGSLTFSFTQGGNPWTQADSGNPDGFTLTISGFFQYSALGFASITIEGSVTLNVTPSQATIDLTGDVNVSFLGDLGNAQGQFVLLYAGSTYQGTAATATTTATTSFTNTSGSLEIFGALELSTGQAFATLQSYGLTVNGAALFQINTTGNDVLVNLPAVSSQPASQFVIQGSIIFDMTILGGTSAYATISYEAGGTSLFDMQGFFDIRLTNDPTNGIGLQMFADIRTLTVGSFLTFNGYGLFVINSSGLAAEMSLNLSIKDIPGVTKLQAGFNLVINTTSQAVTFVIPTVTLPSYGSPAGADSVVGVAIYDASGNQTGTATSLVIPAGPPRGLLQADGTYATVGPTGPYVVIAASGEIDMVGLVLTGDFRFELSSSSSGLSVSMVLDVQGNVGSLANVTVFGAIQLDSSGLVALLSISGNATSNGNYGTGLTLDANFQLAIDTQAVGSPDVTEIGGVTLPGAISAGTFLLEGTGTLTLYLTPGTGFVITGSILAGTTTINGNSVNILSISGNITATVGGSTLLTAAVNGSLLVLPSQGGLAGELSVTINAGNPLNGSGFSFNGSFDFEINTTGVNQTVPGIGSSSAPIVISGGGGAYSEIHASGTLTFGTATNGFALGGNFYLSVGSNGLAISTNVSFTATIGGSTLMTLNASGAMEITSAGLAASFTLTASSGSPFSMSSAFSFSGSFIFQVNTMNQAVNDNVGGTLLQLPKGPYFQISVGTISSPATLTLGSASSGLQLAGTFTLTVSSSGLAVSAAGSLSLIIASNTYFSATFTGALLINGSGIAAQISLTISSQPGAANIFSFDASFLLQVNTTGSAISSINGLAVNLPGGSAYFNIVGSGSMTLAGFVTIYGTFSFSVINGAVVMSINASLTVFGVRFTVNGFAGIYGNTIAMQISLSIGGNNSPTATIIPGVLALSGQFILKVNTTSNSTFVVNGTTYTIAPNTLFDINIPSASVNLFGFTLASGSFDIKEVGGVFSATGSFSFNFFGFITFNVAFYFDSQGNFWFYGSTSVTLGSSDFNIHGTLVVEFASNSVVHDSHNLTDGKYGSPPVKISQNFYLYVSGGVTAFGYDFADIAASVSINGSDVSISVYVSINLGLFSVGGTVTIDLGSIGAAPALPPPPPALGSLNGGVLTLNIGPNALNRLFQGSPISAMTNEAYTIMLAPGSPTSGAENIWVIAPGVYSGPAEYAGTQTAIPGSPPPGAVEYDGVTSIVANTGSSNTTISIGGNVKVPVTITAGSGKNQLILGGGLATITGTTGNDTVFGGSGGVIFHAGTGTSVFIGGNGNNTIYDPGTVSIVEGYVTQAYDSNSSTYSLVSVAYSYYNLSGSTLTYGNGTTNYTDTLVGTFSLITLTAPGSGAASFAVNNYSGNVVLNANGNSSIATSIETDNGNLSLTGSVVTQSNGTTGTITLQSNVTTTNSSTGVLTVTPYVYGGSLNLYGGAGNNTFTVNSWSGSTGVVALDGKGGSDAYIINFQNSGSFTANVNDSGTGGTDADVVTVYGTTTDNTINLNGSSVLLGSQKVNYTGIENLNVYTKNGNDTVNVTATTTVTTIYAGNGNDIFNLQSISNPTTVNLGTGTNTVNVGTLAPTVSGGTLNQIQALLTVNGGNGGTNTLYLDDSADNSAATATLTATSLTGAFGGGGLLNYSGIANFSLYLGNGNHTVNVQGMNGTVNITLGSGTNQINIGSNAGPIITDPVSGNSTNTGSVLDQLVGILNFTGTGPNTVNVDDSGGNLALAGALTPTSIQFLNLVRINLPTIVGINIALSQANDLFAVADTIVSASTAPVIVIDGNGGDDTFIITDTHAVMTVNGGDGEDSFYNFGNSSVLYLNGNAGDDSFYIYASVSATSPSNVDAGAADSNGNKIYSYRVNAPVNINGGSGNDKVYIFGTVLNDVIVISGTQVTGAGIDVTFTNVEQLTVEGLGGDDTFYIESIAIPTTVIGDGSLITVPPSYLAALASLGVTLPNLDGNAPPATSFNDTFYVGWQSANYIPGSLAGIVAPLTIYGDNGPNADNSTTNTPNTTDTIYVDDSGDTASRNFTLNSTTLTSDAFGAGGSLIYDSAVENLNLSTSTGNNNITINGTGTATQTSIYGGAGNDAFVVNDSNGGALASPLALFGGLNTFAGDTLTVNGAPEGNTFDLTGFTIDGAGATISYEQFEKLTINAAGATTFNVIGDLVPTFLNGSNAGDTFNINSNIVPLTIAGGMGDDTFVINANSGTLTVTDAAGTNHFTVNGNSGTLTLTGGTDTDTFVINGNSGTLTANGGAGDDAFTVNSLSAPATLNGGTGNDSFTVNAPLSSSLTANGGGDAGDLLTVNATTGNDSITLTGTTISGVGATINYHVTNLVINGVAGNDTFFINGTTTGTTTINGATHSNDTFNVQATTGALYLYGGVVGSNVFNLGSLAPLTGGVLGNLAGPVFIMGGSNTVNVDDTGDALGGTGTLTATTLTGFGMGAGITYSGVIVLNINLGSGNDIFNVQSTNATTITTLNTGLGANTVNVGSLMPATGGLLDGVQGALIIVGSGNDTLNADNTGDTTNNSGTLTATTLTGLGLGLSGITFSGLMVLNINLGSGNDTFNVLATNAITVTTLNTGAGTNIINVGSLSPAVGGILDNIKGALVIVGSGSDTLNVDDTGSTTNKSGTLTATTLTGLAMGAGGVTYSGLTTLNINLGSGSDTFTVTGVTNSTATTINGGPGTNTATLNFSGDFAGVNLTLLHFATTTLAVGGDFSGLLNDSGAITTATIGGSLTSTGVLNAGSIATMTVGVDLAGLVNVTGLLGTLTVTGGTPGEIIAGDIHVITVLAGYGNKVLQVIEGGIERQIQANPVNGGAMPGTVHFAFVYDSQTAADPQLAIQITDTNPAARSYNLALVVVNSSTAKFNLALVDSYLNGKTGISNISLQGDLLNHLSTPELQLATGLTTSSRAGVVLPADSITGVEVSGILPIGSIDVAGIEGLAFAILTTAAGKPVNVNKTLGSAGNLKALWKLLGSNAAVNPATDAFVIPFNATHSVRLYAHINAKQDLEQVMTLTDESNDNLPITAYVQIVPTANKSIQPVVQSLALVGAGGSVNSLLSIANLTSTGPLGDVTITAKAGATVNNAAGLGNVTAPSIFGSINVTKTGIYGVIQTTSGDLGQTISKPNGEISGVTFIDAKGTITGEIISRGNLVSSIKTSGAFSGVIAAQGDIGAIQRDSNGNAVTNASGALSRFGGITIAKNDSGQIIALGNIFGNVTVSGTMTGRLTAKGQAVAGLPGPRSGILGSVKIKTFALGSAIVSGGLIGDLKSATTVTLGSPKGFVAAVGAVNLKSKKIPAANLLQNLPGGSNHSVLAAIFTDGGLLLGFDTGGSLQGLILIETDLAALKDNGGTLGGTIS